ncbi:SRPBCC family protein [Gelidibacter mesophilus]|uniref:SRPBCC family protein n=1 Tax=Gelidibacter mesophilus TaxID=169050 RepID=UPI0004831DC8|nr:SRPBCC family protein [Gelidibacter mesophilus]
MPKIVLKTFINANQQIVFDLSRSIDLHKISTQNTKETAIAGRTSGLLDLNESVTWRAKHFGFYHQLTSKITELYHPHYFADEMVSGIFKNFKHEHHFKDATNGTLMTDIFTYCSPYGVLGRLADQFFLKKYMFEFLSERNQIIKEYAESERWKAILEKS